jgi:hypothetical protein
VEKSLDKMAGSIHRISRQRWSSRVITNVVGEVENVIQKVQLGDQSVFKFNILFKNIQRAIYYFFTKI